jgi:hypothetical protein
MRAGVILKAVECSVISADKNVRAPRLRLHRAAELESPQSEAIFSLSSQNEERVGERRTILL